ncbi:TonB-dependent receptor domain-containing protein [Telmatospirillum sp.]|uniref:TonB-dependent receptor plug domain-containing protein n=1 Tax=Telmatospirillum sp. TaxID=2079197 RepID=UPI00283C1F8E|nr:TonB-dependent receptor [Telmatospirillum sp.]MDR3436162.1 TonB-dependent receptor [Telmatospirillum sp.]
MSRPTTRTALWTVLSFAGGFSAGAEAQTLDYDSLENLFGEPITTAATGTPQKAHASAANMTIITADEIRQSGSRNIPQILSRVPGLDILRSGAVAYDVGVRGYQEPMQSRLLVLLDGRQVFQDDYSRTVWENLPVNVDDIRQIEVVTGAASALFGSNASGGVVNIITYSPLYETSDKASVSYGSNRTRQGDVTASGRMEDLGGIKISAGGMNGQEFGARRSSSEQGVTQDPAHRYVAASQVFQLSSDLQAFSDFSYSKSRSTEAYFSGRLGGIDDFVSSARGGFTWQSALGTIKGNAYWNHSRVENNDSSPYFVAYADTTDLFVNQLEDAFRVGSDHTFRIFGEYRHIDFRLDAPQVAPQSPALAEDVYVLGGTWLWQIRDDVSWTNAARIERLGLQETGTIWSESVMPASAYDHSLATFSDNSGVVYTLTEQDTARLAYGRGVQMPRLLDYGFIATNWNTSGSGRLQERVGNPFLKPTIVRNYEIDFDHKMPAVFSTMRTAVFFEQNTSLINTMTNVGTVQTSVSNATRTAYSVNMGDSDGYGGEIQIKGQHPSGLRWDASYSYAIVEDSPSVKSALGVGYHDSTPKHHVRLLLGYSVGPWEFDGDGEFLSSDFTRRSAGTDFSTYTPGYSTLSARIGYSLNEHLTLSLSGTNLSQARTWASAFPSVERQALLTLSARY